LIELPVAMVTLAGLKAVAVICTVFVTVLAGRDAPARASASAPTAMSTKLRIA
jgi:hypothetical protein